MSEVREACFIFVFETGSSSIARLYWNTWVMPPPQTSVCWDYRHEPHSQLERETGIVESGSGGSTLGGRKGAQAKGNTGSSEAGKVILWGPISAPGFPKGSFCRHLDFSHKPTGGGVLGVQGVIVQCSSLSRLSLLVQRLSRTSLILVIVTHNVFRCHHC